MESIKYPFSGSSKTESKNSTIFSNTKKDSNSNQITKNTIEFDLDVINSTLKGQDPTDPFTNYPKLNEDQLNNLLRLVSTSVVSIELKQEPTETTFLERLYLEEEELGKKIVGLNKGLQSDGFAEKVGEYQFELLSLQHSTMVAYRRILLMRIKDLTK